MRSLDAVDIPVRFETQDCESSSFAKAYDGDAGFDLRATQASTIEPLNRAQIPCGFSIAIPEGYAGLVLPRSGLATSHGITVLNAPGLIDSGFRGEVKAILYNSDTDHVFEVLPGDRIAQLVIIKLPDVNFIPVEQLDITSRNEKGFGSSGVE